MTKKVRHVFGTLASVIALTLGGIAAPANANTNNCYPSASLNMSSLTRVASGYADCVLPANMKVSVTVALYADGYEITSAYRSFVSRGLDERFTGKSVSWYLTSRNICAKTFVNWQLPDGRGGLKWNYSQSSTCS